MVVGSLVEPRGCAAVLEFLRTSPVQVRRNRSPLGSVGCSNIQLLPLMRPFLAALAAVTLASALVGADRMVVTATNSLSEARPSETIVVPFAEVRRVLGDDIPMHNVQVRELPSGKIVPAQVLNFRPNLRPAVYDDLVFQHDFTTGESSVTFVVERTKAPVAPFETKVFARHVPERHDDFAWENDRIGHRIYGPELDSPAAGKSRLKTSGIDVWAKRVRYPIVDRWYSKGHDAYHVDTGEGIDTYTVRTGRGCGGTGVWDGQQLWVSGNWASWRVLANGPIRAVFEITYAPWEAGPGIKVSETKRFTVDAGQNLDRIESTFSIEGGNGEATIAVGLQIPPDAKLAAEFQDEKLALSGQWQEYAKAGGMGIGAILEQPTKLTGFAVGACEADSKDRDKLSNRLLLTRIKHGETLAYRAGAGWVHSGDFANSGAWKAYLEAVARRLAAPVTLKISTETQP